MCPDKSSLFRSRQYLRLRCLPHCMHNWRLQHLKSCPRNYFKRQYVMGQRCRMRCYNAIYATMQQAATVAILQSTIANVSQQQLCEMGSHINVCRRCYNGILHAMRQWSIVCNRLRQIKGSGQLLSSGAINNGVWCATTEYCVVCQYCVSQHLNLRSDNQ